MQFTFQKEKGNLCSLPIIINPSTCFFMFDLILVFLLEPGHVMPNMLLDKKRFDFTYK